jgi:hypothetical protein
MCANCVANVDAAAAAVGGIAGLRMWFGVHLRTTVTASRVQAIAIVTLLAFAVGPFVLAEAIG